MSDPSYARKTGRDTWLLERTGAQLAAIDASAVEPKRMRACARCGHVLKKPGLMVRDAVTGEWVCGARQACDHRVKHGW